MFLSRPLFTLKPNRPALVKRIKEQVDWHTLKPGTPAWIKYWKSHPELQEEMLKFKEENHV